MVGVFHSTAVIVWSMRCEVSIGSSGACCLADPEQPSDAHGCKVQQVLLDCTNFRTLSPYCTSFDSRR